MSEMTSHQDIVNDQKWVSSVRDDFPFLHHHKYNPPIAYLDNGASSQKPKQVLECIENFYREKYSNVHRGTHLLSQLATTEFERARNDLAKFLGASSENEIVFTRGLTESVNLLASSLGDGYFSSGDEIIVSMMEHHSNFVPWQMLCEKKGLAFKVCKLTDQGELDLDHFQTLLSEKTKLVSLVHASNVVGTINPIEQVSKWTRKVGALLAVDGAQAPHHFSINVEKLGCDFYMCTGHKMYAPTGIGVLWGREELLNRMQPYHGGGEMVEHVSVQVSTYKNAPARFEAGTPNIVGAVAMARAAKYIQDLGYENILRHENLLLQHAQEKLMQVEGLRMIGQSSSKVAVCSFVIDGFHPHDLATILDQEGIAVRVGHHCAQPLHTYYGVEGSLRASFGVYNTLEEVDRLFEAIQKAKRMLHS
ncbi:MAG: cysteine desulfurase [Bdellovibrionales bacterium]|nr:cysteine desulfurase [Bdellovibrionales bacterium]